MGNDDRGVKEVLERTREKEADFSLVDEEVDAIEYRMLDFEGAKVQVALTRNVNYNINEERHTVTREAAELHKALAEIESKTRVEVAKAQYVTPVRLMMRPVWMGSLVAAAGAIAFFCVREYALAAGCVGAAVGMPLLDKLIDRVKKAGAS